MSRWSPSLQGPLREADMAAILDAALRVLAEIGVGCADPGIARQIEAWPHAEYTDGRVRFRPTGARQHLEARCSPAPAGDEPEPPFSMGGCWAGLSYCDPATMAVRPATSDETALMARLWDARGHSGVVPLQPGDVPPALVTLTAERIGLENSRWLGGSLPVTDPTEVSYLIDMNLAAGRRYRLVEQVAISPLRLNCIGVATALRFRDNPDVDVDLTGAIPIAGATAPLEPWPALVQSVAESLAFDIISTTLGFTGGIGLRVEPFDFCYCGIVFGSAEWCLYRAPVLQMTEYLTGRRPRSGVFRTSAKLPDEHAAAERMASVLWQALLGIRSFGAVGQLSVDEVFSPQQAVIDADILHYVERVVTGFDTAPPAEPPVELIRRGVAEGSFIGAEETARRFREFCWFPELFRHWGVGRWRAERAPSILDEAWARAQQEIATSTHQLDDAATRAVRHIYNRAAEYVRMGPHPRR